MSSGDRVTHTAEVHHPPGETGSGRGPTVAEALAASLGEGSRDIPLPKVSLKDPPLVWQDYVRKFKRYLNA